MPAPATPAKKSSPSASPQEQDSDQQFLLGFERLSLWQEAIQWAKTTYEITDTQPNSEHELLETLRRYTTRVTTVLATGKSSYGQGFFIKYLWGARGQVFQTISLIMLIKQLKLMPAKEIDKLNDTARSVNRMLKGLIDHLEDNGRSEHKR